MQRLALTLSLVALAALSTTLALAWGSSAGSSSPTARTEAIVKMWRAHLRSGALADPTRVFANPSQATLSARLRLAASRYHFTVLKVEIFHPRESAPLVVVEAKDKHALAASTAAILHL